jgi:hypothetical protein
MLIAMRYAVSDFLSKPHIDATLRFEIKWLALNFLQFLQLTISKVEEVLNLLILRIQFLDLRFFGRSGGIVFVLRLPSIAG